MIKIIICCTGRNSLKEKPYGIKEIIEYVDSIEKAQEFLTGRYGKLPKGRNKIYVDNKDGNTEVVGFTHSFWNDDISHVPVVSWFQTDWITAVYVVETPVNILVKSNGTK